MGSRSRVRIETNRAELIVNPTTFQKPGVGNVSLDSGASGSVDSITVDSVNVMSSAVAFNTSLSQTATDVAANINANTSAPNYFAHAVDAVIYIYQESIVAGTLTVASTATTIGTTDTNLSGGAVGAGGYSLGFTEAGVEVEVQDQYIEDSGEEDGSTVTKIFFNGGSPIMRTVLKQFDPEVLETRFPGRFSRADQRIQIPGTLNPGDNMVDEAVTLELRPDSTHNSAILAFKAVLIGRGDEPTRFRTTEAKQVALEFRCLEDTSIGSGDGRYNYRTLGAGPAYSLSLT